MNFFDLDKETWVDQDINIVDGPEGRYGCSAVVYEDSMIVFGGTGSKETFNDLWSFSFEKLKWNRLEVYSKYVPPKSSYHSMNIKDNFIYVYGGYYETLYYETLSRFELTEQKWDQINYSGTGPKGVRLYFLNFRSLLMPQLLLMMIYGFMEVIDMDIMFLITLDLICFLLLLESFLMNKIQLEYGVIQ